MKVDRLEFARTVGILDFPALSIMTVVGIILLLCVGTEEYTTGHGFILGFMGIVYAMRVVLVKPLPKDVEVRDVAFGSYEEMGDFGGCYLTPICTVHYLKPDGTKVYTRIHNPKGATRATLVKWRNRIKEIAT
ncbi:hypothetical protein VPHK369_0107 [Vibrio phage K369]